MKTITQFTFMAIIALMMSCEGPVGPPGEDGLDGDLLLGTVFEIEGDFTSANNYSLTYTFPKSVKVYDSDIVLVYILWEQVAASGGKTMDVWRLLPQTIVMDGGVLQYNFDYTVADVQVFLQGTVNFNTLRPSETQDQVFRIAILPAAFARNNSLDIFDFNAVMQSLKISPSGIEKLSPAGNINGNLNEIPIN